MNALAPVPRILVIDDHSSNALLFARALADAGYRLSPQTAGPATLLSNCSDSKYDLISLAAVDRNSDGAGAHACLKSINNGAYLTVLVISDAPHGHQVHDADQSQRRHARHPRLGPFAEMTAWFAAIAARFALPKAGMRRYHFGVPQCGAIVATTSTT